LSGLSDAQWRFKPTPDVWSIAEIAEHVAFVEHRVTDRVHSLGTGTLPEPGRSDEEIDARVGAAVRSRDVRAKTPPAADPTGKLGLAECIDDFEQARNRNVSLLDEPHPFRGRLQPHPVLGPLDGYQWMIAGSSHCARHVAQIRELKSHPDFPKS
jgi:hypothetical protein